MTQTEEKDFPALVRDELYEYREVIGQIVMSPPCGPLEKIGDNFPGTVNYIDEDVRVLIRRATDIIGGIFNILDDKPLTHQQEQSFRDELKVLGVFRQGMKKALRGLEETLEGTGVDGLDDTLAQDVSDRNESVIDGLATEYSRISSLASMFSSLWHRNEMIRSLRNERSIPEGVRESEVVREVQDFLSRREVEAREYFGMDPISRGPGESSGQGRG